MITKRGLVPLLISLAILGCNKKESPTEPQVNNTPTIERIVVNPSEPFMNEEVTLECRARDENNNELSYDWRCDGGYFNNIDKKQVIWNAPNSTGEYHITAKVEDPEGKSASRTEELKVTSRFDTAYVVGDGYVDSERPDFISQRDESDVLSLIHWFGTDRSNTAYLKFIMDNIEGNVKSARLLLDVIGGSGSIENPSFYLHEASQSWSEYAISYNNQPAINLNPEYHFNLPWDNRNVDTVSFDITSLAKKWISSPSQNKGFCLKPSLQMDGGYSFTSKEATNWPWTQPPRIIVEKEH